MTPTGTLKYRGYVIEQAAGGVAYWPEQPHLSVPRHLAATSVEQARLEIDRFLEHVGGDEAYERLLDEARRHEDNYSPWTCKGCGGPADSLRWCRACACDKFGDWGR